MSKKKSKIKEPELEDLEDIDINDIVTDSEEEYSNREKELLEKVRTKRTTEDYDSDVEVYGFKNDKEETEDEDEDDDAEEERDSMESDIEGLEEDLDILDDRAWGKRKGTYYHTDYVDQDYGTLTEKDLAEAEIEEQEARSIQKRLAEQLDDADFGFDFVQESVTTKEQADTDEIVKTDLTKLSKRQKQVILQKESPEFSALVNDFKVRMTEARDVLAPFLKLVDQRIIPGCAAVSFVKTKYHLLLNYCVNISFYLMLKAKRLPVNSHPVIKRLAQYRQLLNQLESGQGNILDEIREILKAEETGKPLYYTADGSEVVRTKSKKPTNVSIERATKKKSRAKDEMVKKVSSYEESNENDFLEEDINLEDEKEASEEDVDDGEDLEDNQMEENDEDAIGEGDGKRAITYQMAKNRGLTPYRKKELRNPRVKHRNKYRKAKIRRKGAVREVRKEIKKYGGEISGIKAGVKKGIKLK